MKKIALLICLSFGLGAFAQTGINFKVTTHGFGKIKQNVPATYSFSFTNSSTKPLIIEVATAECGCTTPVYSKEPIAAGKTSTIQVTYNAANLGTFSKHVNVKFANINPPTILTIEGEVIAASKTK